MIKKLFFILTILLTATLCFAQQQHVIAKRVEAKDSLKIADRWVKFVLDDTSFLDNNPHKIATSNAIYDFVTGRQSSVMNALSDTADALRSSGIGVSNGDKGDITVSGGGATWTIDNDAVTYAKMQNVSASSRFMGRFSTGSGNMEEMTPTVATSMLDVFTSGLKGLAPASGGGTTNFLRADGTWAVPPGGGGGGGTYTVSNLGGGLDNYSTQSGNDFRFNTFNTNDFDLSSNLISIDYANGQKVSNSVPGFATSAQKITWDSVTYFRNTGATGESLLIEITAGYLLGIKKLIAGTNIDFDVADSSITINSTGGGGGRFGYPGEDDDLGVARTVYQNGFPIVFDGQQDGVAGGGFAVYHSQDSTSDLSTFVVFDQLVQMRAEIIGVFAGDISVTPGEIVFSQDGGNYRFANSKTVTNSTDSGVTGQIAWDANYIYVCIATDTWRRVAHATW